MKIEWKYFLFLIWISYLIISGVLLFARGFLLSRDTFPDQSSCIKVDCKVPNECSADEKPKDVELASQTCFKPQAKVVLLIIDALRFDFTEYNEELDDPLPYQNKMPIISETLKKYPNNSRLFKFIADPPTTTSQRLKALTTGSLPTFVDAGSNFATPEINEDNLIDQMVQNNRSVIFMGDDTWGGLYPNRFKRAWNFPSFNVWDLDLVDRGIEKNIYNELEKNDWDLLIAHFLGVDHCGHRYGPNHPEMKRKLTEMNENIKKILGKIDDETMLIVIGDHGMTHTGDHGGESDYETNSALFIYSPFTFNNFLNPSDVKQIDLIPTLSTILGIPTPFSNLGTLILDALPAKTQPNYYLSALWHNLRQTYNYIKKYTEHSTSFSKENLEYLDTKYENLKSRVNKIQSRGQFDGFAKECTQLMKFQQKMCEEIWVQFDSFSMTHGLLILFLTLFFTFLIIDGVPSKKLIGILSGSFVPVSVLSVSFVGIASLISFLFYSTTLETLLFSTGVVSVLFLSSVVLQNWGEIASNWYENVKKSSLDSFVRFCLLISSLALFSNSYVIEEASLTAYLILALLAFIVYQTNVSKLRNKFKIYAVLTLVAVLLRFSTYYWTCREEQKWCIDFDIKKHSNTFEIVVSTIILAILTTVFKFWLRSTGNLSGFAPSLRYFPSLIVVCMGGYWILTLQIHTKKNQNIIDTLSICVFVLSVVSIVAALFKPLCVYVFSKKDFYSETSVPQLFKKLKESLKSENVETPMVAGLATVYSATFVVISTFVTLILCLLLGSNLAPSGVIMYFTSALILVILGVAQQHKTDNLEISNASILTWSFLSTYFFYGTGHASQFPSIHWNSAFVGRIGSSWGSELVAPAVLVILETFSSQIFIGLLIPMLLIVPHTLMVMWKGICPNKKENQGEVALYEEENRTFYNLFVICCKYFLCNGIRMFSCSLAATIHCRHLMVWNIFAPKFMFESVSIIITMSCVLISYLIFIRIHYKLDTFLNNLYKSK